MRTFSILLFCLCACHLWAQNKAFERAKASFNQEEYADALEQFDAAKGVPDADLFYYKAQCYQQLGQTDSAASFYERLLPLLKNKPEPIYEYAVVAQQLGEYDKARKLVKRFLLQAPNHKKGQILLASCQQSDSLSINRRQLFLEAMSINTDYDDFSAHFSHNYQTLYFCSNRPEQNGSRNYSRNGSLFINLYASEKGIASGFSKVSGMGELNSKRHEGPMAYDSSSQTLYFTRTLKTPHTEYGYSYTLGIFSSQWNGDSWGKPKAFEHNVKGYSVGHPALSADGKRMYFTSDQPGTMGATDIYSCEKTADGWSAPMSLGKEVNTIGREMFPTLLPSGELSFASDGHPGLGGLDVFVLHKGKAQNPGAPINSSADDFALSYRNKKQTTGYVSSNREGRYGGDNIYSFKPISIKLHGYVYDKTSGKPAKNASLRMVDQNGSIKDLKVDADGFYSADLLPEESYELQFTAPNYELERGSISTLGINRDLDTAINAFLARGKTPVVEGIVLDREKTEPLVGAGVELQNISEGKKEALTTDTMGYYVFFVDSTKAYELSVDHPDYFIESLPVIEVQTLAKNPIKRMANIPRVNLNRIVLNKPLELENIYYDYDKYDITPVASKILDTLSTLMKDNSEIIVELSSHTDIRGTDEYNIELSKRRAQAVIDYLVGTGIESYRIVFKFYGKTELAYPCPEQGDCPERIHQLNRRTEFRVIDY